MCLKGTQLNDHRRANVSQHIGPVPESKIEAWACQSYESCASQTSDSDTTVTTSCCLLLCNPTVVSAGHGDTVYSGNFSNEDDDPTMSPTGTSAVPDKHIVIVSRFILLPSLMLYSK